ncbi:QcrA and Rieske domain-containing protein [Haladaptatus caseinilyticus]|uniref:QcrA and Rieske domain-containing protein n=1 Tax=Haladaptatus caseinilyticus TaxID=2993314 RepID=UPI00224A65B4|nr:Rieske 2Fe-2S domain-containing protein [Haladaptatus caseinilyticus]
MSEADKYPEDTSRRRFVKGVVGSAALAGIGTGTVATLKSATAPSGAGGGIVQYYGVENVAGPAPRGMPQIPVEIEDNGDVKGVWPKVQQREQEGRTVTVAEMQLGGVTYSSQWFQYCGVQTYPGIAPDAEQDNYFRYTSSSQYEWQSEDVEAGAIVNINDFEDYESWGNGIGKSGLGKPATATWRSQDVPASGTIPVQLIRSPRIEEMANQNQWIGASTQEGFIAIMDKCTHFCCVPLFKGDPGSAKFNAENEIYCPCHQSVYDPFSIEKVSFVALPRPDDSSGGGSA